MIWPRLMRLRMVRSVQPNSSAACFWVMSLLGIQGDSQDLELSAQQVGLRDPSRPDRVRTGAFTGRGSHLTPCGRTQLRVPALFVRAAVAVRLILPQRYPSPRHSWACRSHDVRAVYPFDIRSVISRIRSSAACWYLWLATLVECPAWRMISAVVAPVWANFVRWA